MAADDEPGRQARWLRRRLSWAGFCLGVLAVPIVALLARGVSVKRALGGGILVGYMALVVLVAIVEIVAPRRAVLWRDAMMTGGPRPLRKAGAAFEKVLGTPGYASTHEMPTARVRIAGVALLFIGMSVALVAWIIFRIEGAV